MTKIDIQNEIIDIILSHNLTLEEMKDILSSTKFALDKIVIPNSVSFKQKDGSLVDKPTETY